MTQLSATKPNGFLQLPDALVTALVQFVSFAAVTIIDTGFENRALDAALAVLVTALFRHVLQNFSVVSIAISFSFSLVSVLTVLHNQVAIVWRKFPTRGITLAKASLLLRLPRRICHALASCICNRMHIASANPNPSKATTTVADPVCNYEELSHVSSSLATHTATATHSAAATAAALALFRTNEDDNPFMLPEMSVLQSFLPMTVVDERDILAESWRYCIRIDHTTFVDILNIFSHFEDVMSTRTVFEDNPMKVDYERVFRLFDFKSVVLGQKSSRIALSFHLYTKCGNTFVSNLWGNSLAQLQIFMSSFEAAKRQFLRPNFRVVLVYDCSYSRSQYLFVQSIPRAFSSLTFDGKDVLMNTLQQFLDGSRLPPHFGDANVLNLLVHGESGSGKSTIVRNALCGLGQIFQRAVIISADEMMGPNLWAKKRSLQNAILVFPEFDLGISHLLRNQKQKQNQNQNREVQAQDDNDEQKNLAVSAECSSPPSLQWWLNFLKGTSLTTVCDRGVFPPCLILCSVTPPSEFPPEMLRFDRISHIHHCKPAQGNTLLEAVFFTFQCGQDERAALIAEFSAVAETKSIVYAVVRTVCENSKNARDALLALLQM